MREYSTGTEDIPEIQTVESLNDSSKDNIGFVKTEGLNVYGIEANEELYESHQQLENGIVSYSNKGAVHNL